MLLRLHNPRTGAAIYPLETGHPDYGPESEAFVRASLQSEPGGTFDSAPKKKTYDPSQEGRSKTGRLTPILMRDRGVHPKDSRHVSDA